MSVETAGVVVMPGFFKLTINGYVALVNVAHISQVAEQKSGGTLLVLTASDGGEIPNHIKTMDSLDSVAAKIAAALSPVKAGGVVTAEEIAEAMTGANKLYVNSDAPEVESAAWYKGIRTVLDRLEFVNG